MWGLRKFSAALVLCATIQGAAAADAAKSYDLTADGNARFLADYSARQDVKKLPDGVMYRVLETGRGNPPISKQDVVTVNYKGWLLNGMLFDSSTPGTPSQFEVGGVIPGWSEVLMKMHEGDMWEVAIPAPFAYGADGVEGHIPPDQTLIFVIDLTKVEYAP